MQQALRYILIFIALLLLQVFLFNNIYFFVVAQPFIFFYFILLLPSMPYWAMLLAGFFTGLAIDIFSGTPGVNAAACTALAFARDPFVRAMKRSEPDQAYSASLTYLGFGRFFFYLFVVALYYQLVRQFLIIFSFKEISFTLIRVVANTLLSVLFIYSFEVIFFYRNTGKD